MRSELSRTCREAVGAQRRSLTATRRTHNRIRGRHGLIISKRNTKHRITRAGHTVIDIVVPIDGHNGSGLVAKWYLWTARIRAKWSTTSRTHASTHSGSRTHRFRLPNSRIQAPNHQTHDSRLASHDLTDQWLVQRRRIYRLALPNIALYVHTMP